MLDVNSQLFGQKSESSKAIDNVFDKITKDLNDSFEAEMKSLRYTQLAITHVVVIGLLIVCFLTSIENTQALNPFGDLCYVLSGIACLANTMYLVEMLNTKANHTSKINRNAIISFLLIILALIVA